MLSMANTDKLIKKDKYYHYNVSSMSSWTLSGKKWQLAGCTYYIKINTNK